MSIPDSGSFRIGAAKQDGWGSISQISGEVSREGLVGDYIGNIGQKYLEICTTFVIDSGRVLWVTTISRKFRTAQFIFPG